jgi:hypothetical protein
VGRGIDVVEVPALERTVEVRRDDRLQAFELGVAAERDGREPLVEKLSLVEW